MNNVFNLVYSDLIIVFLFLGGTLFAGFSHKVNKLEDFALGGRKFPLFAQVCTIVATWMSGSSFQLIFSKIYSQGLYYYIASAGATFSFIIVAIFFIPRMGDFLGHNSIAEAIGGIYGNLVRSITALTGIFCAIGYTAMQFKIFGGLFEFFWNFDDKRIAIVLAGLIVTLYSATGGIKAVTYTDMVQFSAFTLAIPFVGVFIWNDWYEKSDTHISTIFENPMFDYKQVLDIANPELWAIVPLLIYFSIPNLGPTMSQRILIGSNVYNIRKSFLISAVVLITLETLLSIIPFLLYAVNPNLDPEKLFGYVMTNYAYPGIQGLIIVGVISMAMSTADSWINSSSVFFANDLFAKYLVSPNKKLQFAKIFSFTIGIVAIFLASIKRNLIDLMLSTTSFYYGMVTPVLIFTVFGFRTKRNVVFLSMLVSFIYLLFVLSVSKFQVDPIHILIAMVLNLFTLLSAHYGYGFLVKLDDKSLGWVGNTGNLFLKQLRKQRKDFIIKIFQSIKEMQIVALCVKYAPKDLRSSLALGIYYIFSTITTMYAQIDVFRDNADNMILIYESIMFLGFIMTTYPLWPDFIGNNFITKFSSLVWFTSIFYVLFFLSIVFVLLTKLGSLQLAVFTANTFVAFLLIGWRIALAFLSFGFVLALFVYQNFLIVADSPLDLGSPLFLFVYLLTLISTIVLLFIKPKEEHSQLIENMLSSANRRLTDVSDELSNISQELSHTKGQLKFLGQQVDFKDIEIEKLKNLKKDFIMNFRNETHHPVSGIISMAEILYDLYHQLKEEEKQRYLIEITGNAKKLVSFLDNMIDLSTLSSSSSELDIQSHSISEIIQKKVDICKKVFFSPIMKSYQEFVYDIQQDFHVKCDYYYIGQVCSNIITNAINYSDSGFILIKCEMINDSEVEISVRDEGIGIVVSELDRVFEAFFVGSNVLGGSYNRGVGLTIAQKIVNMHGGQISIKNNDTRGVTCSFTLRLA